MTSVDEQSSYLAAFAELPKDGTPWLVGLRERAIERFTALGFPTTHHEEWRFTNVAPIVRTAFQPARPARVETVPFTVSGAHTLVVVNGRLAFSDSALKGVRTGSLADALRAEPQLLEQHYGRYAAFDEQAFVALNTALAEDGVFVHVPRNRVVDRPIHIVYISTGAAEPTVSHPRALVLAGANAQLALIETYLGYGDQPYFANAVTEICAGENAVVDHYKVQLEQLQAFHVATLQVEAGRGANFSSHSIGLGGALVRNDVNVVLSEGTEATLNGLYLVDGRQHVDNHTVIDHAKPHGASHELYKGILDGHASAVFNGKIYVRKDAQKTDAKQTNKNLVLSEDAVINTKPELQIWADDVRCTHGATIGQLDAEAIFYLQSRGISREDARDILTQAFARDILDRVRVAPLRERLEQVLSETLHAHGH